MHENHGRCGDGRQGPQKQVAASLQADWDLGHVPMMLCLVPFLREIRHADREQVTLIIRAKALIASARREAARYMAAVLSAEP